MQYSKIFFQDGRVRGYLQGEEINLEESDFFEFYPDLINSYPVALVYTKIKNRKKILFRINGEVEMREGMCQEEYLDMSQEEEKLNDEEW